MSSARPELSKEFVAGHKRRRMMDAIAELTAANGYEATKIADVVRRAGVARKTLYDNFDGKEQLFLSALDESIAEVRSRVATACEEHEGSWERSVEAAIGALLRFVDEKPAAARMCLVESISATPASTRRYDAAVQDFVAILGRESPRHRDLPETIEESLVGGVAWILQQRMRRPADEKGRDLLPELSQFVLSPYRGVSGRGDTGRRK